MIRLGLAAAAFGLVSSLALAQPAPSPATPPPPPPNPPASPPSPPPARDAVPGRPGPGAWIKVVSPNGTEIAVRCTEGEPTRACADIVAGLAEKMMPRPERRREPDMDEDRERRERPRGDERYRSWQ